VSIVDRVIRSILRGLCTLLVLTLALAACKKSALREQSANPKRNPPAGMKVDPCALITGAEVGQIQQANIIGTQLNEVPTGQFVTSQCYYTSAEPDCSVTIAIVQRDPLRVSTDSIRKYWQEVYVASGEPAQAQENGHQGRKETRAGGEEEEEKRAVRAIKIDGIGEGAYWSGNRFGGVLYVLQREKIVRVSVGGPSKTEEKLEKSKLLAQKSLSRLPK
jgi:hypothetical protein